VSVGLGVSVMSSCQKIYKCKICTYACIIHLTWGPDGEVPDRPPEHCPYMLGFYPQFMRIDSNVD
jgi:hypothetical protein